MAGRSMEEIDALRVEANAAWAARCEARVRLDHAQGDLDSRPTDRELDEYLEALAAYRAAVQKYEGISAFIAGALYSWHQLNGTPIPFTYPERP